MTLRHGVACACAALAVLLGCQDDGLGWDLERMIEQPRYEPYAASSFFEDGSAMRTPPAGTVPRASGASRSTAPARPPLERALLERGRERFDIYCAPCHGLDGTARTHVAVMMRLRPPPSLHEPRIRARDVAQLQRLIRTGYGLMPSYDALLTGTDEWAIAFYVQALWLSQRAPLDRLPPDLRERALRSLETAGAEER